MDAAQKRWALFPWFEEHGVTLVHPDDLDAVRGLQPYGLVLELVDDDGEFVRLRYGRIEFRGKRSLVRPLSITPPREIGESVTLTDGRSAVVLAVRWHGKREAAFYQLIVDGKRRSKRYWDADFVDRPAGSPYR